MKISYNTLKRYIPDIKSPEELAQDLIMHTAEVEEIEYEWKNFDNMVIWEIKEINSHPDADKLKVCKVDIWWEETQIVCGWTNLKLNQKVAVAKIWAVVSWHGKETITMKKTKIRWVESNWMICASEEIWLKDEFPAESETEILDLSTLNSKAWTPLKEALNKNEVILEIDNKAINHRPDLFSHIWIIREIFAISWKNFDYKYEDRDFSNLKKLEITNEIPKLVKRYIWLKISWVKNIESPDYIKEVLNASKIASKWLLIDLSNYSLYMYGQPTHIFDADKISWNITIRKAKDWESFVALDDKEYKLTKEDIVIADEEKILALWWIIWGKSSAVTDETKNIIIEGANFDQATLRMTWKRLGIRTDSLNIFEKDILPVSAKWWVSLIVSELEKFFPEMKLEAYNDLYHEKQKQIEIDFDLDFVNRLIWKEYSSKQAKEILKNLWIEIKDNKILVPAWRKDLNYKADIAEEIARIDWYDKIEAKIPEVQLWAVIQDNIYKIKRKARDFFVNKWFFDTYTYSFINKDLAKKTNSKIDNLVELKNSLSEEATHLKSSLIQNLLLSLEKNIRDFKDLKIFEIEKVFERKDNDIIENYFLAWLITSKKDIVYYEIQEIVWEFLKNIWVDKFFFKKQEKMPPYAHSWRTAGIIVRWKNIWYVGEIHPKVAKNFDLKERIWFFEINLEDLKDAAFSTPKYKEISNFQWSNFDISFLVEKDFEWAKIVNTIKKINPKIIKKVELFDIYEDEEKIPGKRSFSFKVYLEDLNSEITDKIKNEIIEEIIKKVEKLWAKLR